jgi:hypothetical protein
VTEPKRGDDGIALGLNVIEKDGIRLEPGETAGMNLHFGVGPDDVGLVLPVDVFICRKGEAPPPTRPPDEASLAVIVAARAELARKRAAGELPPITPRARALLTEMRARLERGDTAATISVGNQHGERQTARTTIRQRH